MMSPFKSVKVGFLIAASSSLIISISGLCTFTEQLSVAQRLVDAVSDQIEDSLSLIHHLQQPTETETGIY